VFALKTFELTIPKEYLDYINNEIKKPKRPNIELLELWLERELKIENEGTYGNLPINESHVTIQLLPNGNYQMLISEVCFSMIMSHVQPEPHSHKINNNVALHCWLDMKTNKVHSKQHIETKEILTE
jgi:hypothetical protein